MGIANHSMHLCDAVDKDDSLKWGKAFGLILRVEESARNSY